MAEQTNQMSMLGADPALVEQLLQAQQEANARQQATLTPLQYPVYMNAQAGMGIGEGLRDIGGAMTGKDLRDPRIIKAEKTQQVLKAVRDRGISIQEPIKYYEAMADEFNKAGMSEEALAVIEKAQSMGLSQLKTGAEIDKIRAEAVAKLREKESSIKTLQREIDAAKLAGRPDQVAELEGQIEKLNRGEYKVVTQGSGDKKQEVLVDHTGRIIKEFTPYSQKPVVSIDMGQKADVAGVGAWKTVWQKMADRFYDKNYAVEQTMDKLEDIRSLVNSGNLNLGPIGNLKSEIARWMMSSKMATPEQIKSMSDTDLLKAYAMDFILPKMKMLGGSDSNEELRAITSSFVNNQWSLDTMRRLLNIAEREINKQRALNKDFEDWMAKGGNPLAFNFNSGKVIDNPKLFGSFTATITKPKSSKESGKETPAPKLNITPELRERVRAANPGKNLTDEQIDAQLQKMVK